MTAQHCLDSNYVQRWEAYNGYGSGGYHVVLQSNGTQKYSRGDGYDVGFWWISSAQQTKSVFMKQGLYRTNIGTSNPVQGATYCFSGQDTQTATYGIACGTSTYYGHYTTNSGEAHYGWSISLSSRTFQPGDSGTTIFQQLVNSEARTVGALSSRTVATPSIGKFAPVVPVMQAYGMVANW